MLLNSDFFPLIPRQFKLRILKFSLTGFERSGRLFFEDRCDLELDGSDFEDPWLWSLMLSETGVLAFSGLKFLLLNEGSGDLRESSDMSLS